MKSPNLSGKIVNKQEKKSDTGKQSKNPVKRGFDKKNLTLMPPKEISLLFSSGPPQNKSHYSIRRPQSKTA